MIKIYCQNLEKSIECRPGITLGQLAEQVNIELKWPVLAALVDNQLKELSFSLYMSHNIEFIDYSHADGSRTYVRSLNFILQKAVAELFPQYSLNIEYNLQNAMYCELREKSEGVGESLVAAVLSKEELQRVKERMQEIIEANLPFIKKKLPTQEAVKLFEETGRYEKALLNKLKGNFFTSVYFLDGYPDHFYGPLLNSTGAVTSWDLETYNSGLMLRSPTITNPYKITHTPHQYKLFDVFKEYSDWCTIMGVHGVGSINKAIMDGGARELIQLSEALHSRKYIKIADEIYKRKDEVRLVLIAGPSSSGKTSTSKRVALQTKILGLNPVVIEMDNYFVDRDKTPRDSDGNYDFEALEAMDVEFLSEQLNDLFDGKTIELPKFDFAQGKRFFNNNMLTLGEKDILIMEGIHGLNPKLTSHIAQNKIYKIYASALTSLSLDENNNISTSDCRLLRRLVRDVSFRGMSPEDTILRWPSVRRGEINNIFPFQENADIMFNSALLYELPMLKYYAEPLLRRIPANSPASVDSIRLLKFLSYVKALQPWEIAQIPPTSIMREFIGGSSFDY